MDQENSEKSVDTYDQFFGAEVCLPDERGIKMMAIVTNLVKENKGKPIGIEHTAFLHITYYIMFHFPMAKMKS